MAQACRHCGTEFTGDGAFCCVGCEAVWHALEDGGLHAFYALRGADARPVNPAEARPFEPAVEALGDGTVCATVGVDGTHCAGCVWLIERLPAQVPGVVDARLNLGRGRLEVRWDPARADFDHVATWLRRFGYSPYALDEGRGDAQRLAEREALVRVGVSWVLAANVMLLVIALYAGLDEAGDAGLWTGARWLAMLLSGASLAYGGREFFRRAWASIGGRISVDLPVALGLAVGWIYSAYATIRGVGEVWFDSVAVLVAALLTARWLHARGIRVASDAMNRIATILPRTARRLVEGVVETVDATALQHGDLVEVRTGDVVPADGPVVEGASTLDRSMLTGEAAPFSATAGARVFAGETNVRGRIVVRVEAAGDDSRFGRLARFIWDDAGPRAQTVQLADRLAAWFVVAILGGAALTALAAAMVAPEVLVPRVVALLVVSCPCALGMATPLAFTVALGRAARAGIFVRGDAVFEKMRAVDTLVLDKTGTLTRGAMRVAAVEGEAEVLRLAAAAERASSHPIAAAFAAYDDGAAVEDFDELPGRGVQARVDGMFVEVRRAATDGIEIRVDGVARATVRLGDALRPEAREFVAAMRARGIEVWVASGDTATTVAGVAQAVGIAPQNVRAELMPEEKLALVEALEAQGRRVAMVGDGVNDAAALRRATVGIAMHGGVDLNAIAADVQLGRGGLRPIEDLLTFADAAVGAVRRNLAFSATYNVLAIVAAGVGVVTPLAAAIAMPLSSVTVVVSSLWQRRPATGPAPQAAPARAGGAS